MRADDVMTRTHRKFLQAPIVRALLLILDWFNPKDLRQPVVESHGWQLRFAWLPVTLVHFYDDGQSNDGSFTPIRITWMTFVWRHPSWQDRVLHMQRHPVTGVLA